jgi:hypothetical protein
MHVALMASMRATIGGPGWVVRIAWSATSFHCTTIVSLEAAAFVLPAKVTLQSANAVAPAQRTY